MSATKMAARVVRGLGLWAAVGGLLAAELPRDEIMEEIGKKAAAVQSYQADMTMSISMMGQAMVSKGRILFRKPDRSYMEMETDMGMMKMQQIMISDGKTMWIRQPAMNMISKIDMAKLTAATKGVQGATAGMTGGTGTADLSNPLQMLDKQTLKLLRADTVEGAEAYVFEGAMAQGAQAGPQAQMPFMPARIQVWVAAKDGLLRKLVMLDKEGKETMSQAYSNIVLNKDYPDSQFQFTPPAGAQVMDMTEGALNMMKQGAGAAGAQPRPAAPAPGK